ncbi:MAG: LapA family protein [Candidatus Rokubacteria bacterium]|nr:LapA family protein [Candidatus Rokubacteria bacterium]MBI2544331.1 LapA family protein [Candidatus Rokubacteria bacterium]MBI2553076.1 LapA family protein [Candidatus Rokubacteria bacterium]
MPVLYLLIAAAAVAIAIFALQNPDQVTIRFLGWQVERAPLAAVILLSGAVGAIIVSLIGFVQRWKLRSKIRQLEARVRNLEVARPEPAVPKPE